MASESMRRLPYNLKSLQVFDAVSRHRSITSAAQELQVTPPAINHHMRGLASEVGDPLVIRIGSRLELTHRGRQIATRLRGAFAEIARTMEEADDKETVVRLSLCSAFAPGWIIKRLRVLFDQQPEFNLQLVMHSHREHATTSDYDAIVTPDDVPDGYYAVALAEERLTAVYSRGSEPSTLPLIAKTMRGERDPVLWTAFASEILSDETYLHHKRWTWVSHYILAHDLARHGLGIALVPDFVAEEELMDGRLAALASDKLATGRTYNLCIKSARIGEPALKHLLSWAREMAELKGGNVQLPFEEAPRAFEP